MAQILRTGTLRWEENPWKGTSLTCRHCGCVFRVTHEDIATTQFVSANDVSGDGPTLTFERIEISCPWCRQDGQFIRQYTGPTARPEPPPGSA